MLTTDGRRLTPDEENDLLSGFLDAYDGRRYHDPLQLVSHDLEVCVPLDGSWYRWGYLVGKAYRLSERRWLLN